MPSEEITINKHTDLDWFYRNFTVLYWIYCPKQCIEFLVYVQIAPNFPFNPIFQRSNWNVGYWTDIKSKRQRIAIVRVDFICTYDDFFNHDISCRTGNYSLHKHFSTFTTQYENKAHALHKKWSFPLQSSSVSVTEGNCGFGHIYWSNP